MVIAFSVRVVCGCRQGNETCTYVLQRLPPITARCVFLLKYFLFYFGFGVFFFPEVAEGMEAFSLQQCLVHFIPLGGAFVPLGVILGSLCDY